MLLKQHVSFWRFERMAGRDAAQESKAFQRSAFTSPAVLDVPDRAFGFFHRNVDMLQRAMLQAASGWIVFFAVDVRMDLAKQLDRAVQTSPVLVRNVNGGMVAEVFSIVDGRALDLANGRVDVLDGDILMAADGGASRTMLQKPPRRSQIGKGVEIGRMLAGEVRPTHG
jgi:hypothetical protein